MAMGKRKAKQESLWVSTEQIARSAGHPFYSKVNEVLEQRKLDQRLEHLCRRFYKPVFGRPSNGSGRVHGEFLKRGQNKGSVGA
jgi:hypothetical protein